MFNIPTREPDTLKMVGKNKVKDSERQLYQRNEKKKNVSTTVQFILEL